MHGMLSKQIKPKDFDLDDSNEVQRNENRYKVHRNVTKMKTESRIKSTKPLFMKIVVKVGQA